MGSLVQLQSLPLNKTPKSQSYFSASPSKPSQLFYPNATSVAFSSVTHHCPRLFLSQLPSGGVRYKATRKQNLGAIHALEAASPTTTNAAERWLLEPIGAFFCASLVIQSLRTQTKFGKVTPFHGSFRFENAGDGDTRHIGFKVEMPGVYEISSNVVTVGRVPEKADLVIPVATVSGVHARIQKKQGSLLVTDLDSTNGTFIDDRRLRPGVVATVSSGSCITFGDTHLAMFRVSKVEEVMAADTGEETEGGLDIDNKPDNTETN